MWGRRVLPPVGRATHNPLSFEGHRGNVDVDSMLAGLPPLGAEQGARTGVGDPLCELQTGNRIEGTAQMKR